MTRPSDRTDFAALRVLVLDMDKAGTNGDVGAYLCGCLRDLGVEQIFDAADTQQAVAIIGGSPINGVLVRCADGEVVDTSRALRAAAAQQPSPPRVVMVAGIDDRAAVQRAFDVGVREFLATPITKAALAARLQRLSARRAGDFRPGKVS